MPKHTINGKKVPRDPMMEKIKGRIRDAKIPMAEIEDALGKSEAATRVRMAKHGREWKVGDICKVAKRIGIPVSEVFSCVDEHY